MDNDHLFSDPRLECKNLCPMVFDVDQLTHSVFTIEYATAGATRKRGLEHV